MVHRRDLPKLTKNEVAVKILEEAINFLKGEPSMTVAQVIVDVPAKQTDRPYDYRIPVHLQEVIKQGMRVIVPFGPRKVQGFVIGIVADSEFASCEI